MQLSTKCILQFNIIKEIKENFQLFLNLQRSLLVIFEIEKL